MSHASLPAGLSPPPPLWQGTEMRGLSRAGLFGLVALLGLLGLWAGTTMIGGAVIAQGQTLVNGKPKIVQSLDGGIVAEIAVKNGDTVTEGQVLVRLDPTLLAINLDIARGRLADALALKARLEAEQQGLPDPVFAWADLPVDVPDTASHEAGQRQIFTARAEVLEGTRDRLEEKLGQLDTRTAGINAQIAVKREQLGYLEQDLANTAALNAKGLVRESQMLDLQRARAELVGQIAGLENDLAGVRSGMRDSALETLQTERAFKESVVTDLRAATAEMEELILEIVTRTEQLDRIVVRAPAAGIVHEMQVGTIGGVVAPGATMLEVIPVNRGIDFEVRVDPRAIDQVYPGQSAEVVLASFDPRTTPKLKATVASVSPGTITDPATGQSYYRIGLSVPPEEMARLGGITLMPGMPVEGFLHTGDRSVLAYLMKPLTDNLNQAFREN